MTKGSAATRSEELREEIILQYAPLVKYVMGRLAIYLIIPPLTWIGAALIEILIDAAL